MAMIMYDEYDSVVASVFSPAFWSVERLKYPGFEDLWTCSLSRKSERWLTLPYSKLYGDHLQSAPPIRLSLLAVEAHIIDVHSELLSLRIAPAFSWSSPVDCASGSKFE